MTSRTNKFSERELKLLDDADPVPVEVVNRSGASRILLTCEHAGRAIPATLGDLGMSDKDMERHIAWDVGAVGVARHLSDLLDATLVYQAYSRLVVDCNRPTHAPDFIPEISDGTPVEANRNLTADERRQRHQEIHEPYHNQIAALLDQRESDRRTPLLISVHSFAPSLDGVGRPWDLGLLFNRDSRLAELVGEIFGAMDHGFNIALNEPYTVNDISDYTVPVHGERRRIPNLLIEIRHDHLLSADGRLAWAERIGAALRARELPE